MNRSRALDIAQRYLECSGYEVVEKDFNCPNGSKIDVVAWQDDELVIVSVVYRNTNNKTDDGFPSERLTVGKIAKIERSAAMYLRQLEELPSNFIVRFDTISLLEVDEVHALVKHHVNALAQGAME